MSDLVGNSNDRFSHDAAQWTVGTDHKLQNIIHVPAEAEIRCVFDDI